MLLSYTYSLRRRYFKFGYKVMPHIHMLLWNAFDLEFKPVEIGRFEEWIIQKNHRIFWIWKVINLRQQQKG